MIYLRKFSFLFLIALRSLLESTLYLCGIIIYLFRLFPFGKFGVIKIFSVAPPLSEFDLYFVGGIKLVAAQRQRVWIKGQFGKVKP